MRLWTLSKKEIDRLELIQLVVAKRLSVTKAAQQADLSRQRMSELVNAYRRDGATSLVSRRRGRPSNSKLSDALKTQVCAIVREHYSDFGPTLAAEYLVARHDITVSRETLRTWMVADGIWTTRAARRYVSTHGRPLALYTDKAGVFRDLARSRSDVSKGDALRWARSSPERLTRSESP